MNAATQWFGILGGPIIWLGFLQVNYALAQPACVYDNKSSLAIMTVIALFGTVAAAYVAWRTWEHAGGGAATDAGNAAGRSRFMGLTGMGVSALSILLVLASAIPIIFLAPCD
jgi:hypothetical protein